MPPQIAHEPPEVRREVDDAAAKPRTEPADATREEIMAAARRIFSEFGLSGARVDDIALQTKKSKRMIYYYFRSKEELFRAVLLEAYAEIRTAEDALRLDGLGPLETLAALVRFHFDYQTTHEHFVRLVMAENVNKGRSLDAAPELVRDDADRRDRLRGLVEDLCGKGVDGGLIRADVDPADLHMTICALVFFPASNRYTFSRIFARDLSSRRALRKRREAVVDTVLRSVATPDAIAAGLVGQA